MSERESVKGVTEACERHGMSALRGGEWRGEGCCGMHVVCCCCLWASLLSVTTACRGLMTAVSTACRGLMRAVATACRGLMRAMRAVATACRGLVMAVATACRGLMTGAVTVMRWWTMTWGLWG